MAFKFLDRLTRRATVQPPMDALYRAVVAIAREPRWYTAGAVPDTLDGRFDMVVLVLSLVLLRLEREPGAEADVVALTERFIADMDGSLRQIGVGDLGVGKQVGRMVGALGGRLGAYRGVFAGAEPLGDALTRNLYRGATPVGEAHAWTQAAVQELKRRVDATPLDRLRGGEIDR
jgi:cytochrome b pre-mRNA-processing protein 3